MSSLEHLWAGWRSEYIEEVTGPDRPGDDDCIFCRILASGRPDSETYIVWRHPDGAAFAILNAYPYCNGHLMIMPARHVGAIEELTAEEGAAVWEGISESARALKGAYRPDALNIGANLGRAAGAGVPGHFHMHVVPRWTGDTNFMTSVANARVLPETLDRSAEKLRAAWPGVP